MKIIKEELRFEENLKKRLEFICEFSKVTPTFVNGSIRKIFILLPQNDFLITKMNLIVL